ncbi:MAG: rSAM/selenodomain-associated transferase 1 [Flavobacteriales bacterium]|jgi:rSAM/selenodomain-associated transferase 1
MPRKSEMLLMTFVKNPELGKAKTRLAKTIGQGKALEVYKALLSHTCSIVADLKVDKIVFYADKICYDDIWSSNIFKKDLQAGGDLGERMSGAFETAFELGYKKVIIIGSDCYDINQEIILEGFSELDNKDVIIGPALDGGYYLLGMKKLYKEIFIDKSWSTNDLMKETLATLENLDLSYNLLTPLSDVDIEEDLKGELLSIVKN